MSGILRSALLAEQRNVESLVPGDGGDALVEFTVGDLRTLGFDVIASFQSQEPAHADVIGDKSRRSTRRLLADLARWTIRLDTDDPGG
jgi:hypothetical protein